MTDKIIKDFNKFRFISSIEKNPSSDKIIYKISKSNYKKNSYESKIFLYSKGKISAVRTQNKTIQSKFFDDYSIIYTSKPDKIRKKHKFSMYIQRLNSKKHYKEIKLSVEVCDFFVLNTDKIVFISSEKINDDIEDFRYEADGINFLENGFGYISNYINKLYIYEIETNKLIQISKDRENVENIAINGNSIYYITNEKKSVFSLFNKPYCYDITSQKNICLYDGDDMEFTYVNSLKNDVIAIGSYHKRYGINENPKFYKIDNNSISLYSDNEYSIGNTVNSDVRYGASSEIKKYKEVLYFLSTREDKSSIYKLENGEIHLVLDEITSVEGYEILEDEIIFYGFNKQLLNEIYSFKDNKIIKITDFSSKFISHISSYKVEKFEFDSNGDILKGYVIYPQNFDTNSKYPAILAIHGGPKTVYSENFIYEMYLLSKRGYFIFYTNPHGSDGRNNSFADIRGRYGTIDYSDFMNLTDEVIKKYQNIDINRLAVIGGSYGGYMTNHIIGNTDRFKTAITQRSISNWISFYATSDIGYYFAPDQNNCKFDISKLWETSPLKNVHNINTPTLIIHSDEDYRCPLEQAFQLFTHLKIKGVKTKLIVYKGENHDLSRSGKVKSRISRLTEILNWFDENL